MAVSNPVFYLNFFYNNVSQANIRNKPFKKKSPRHPEVDVLRLRAQGGAWVNKFFKNKKRHTYQKKNSLLTNIRTTYFDQKSPQHPEEGVLG